MTKKNIELHFWDKFLKEEEENIGIANVGNASQKFAWQPTNQNQTFWYSCNDVNFFFFYKYMYLCRQSPCPCICICSVLLYIFYKGIIHKHIHFESYPHSKWMPWMLSLLSVRKRERVKHVKYTNMCSIAETYERFVMLKSD